MRRISPLILVTILVCGTLFSVVHGITSSTVVSDLEVKRVIPLTVKVIFIGSSFDPQIVDVSLLESLLPQNKSIVNLVDEVSTGISYRFTYEFLFASSSFRSDAINFLKSIETVSEEENPWFYLYEESEDWFVTTPTKAKTYVYDAKAVEKWLTDRMDEFGGFPEQGYVFFMADLRDLPSASYSDIKEFLTDRTYERTPPLVTAHYYGMKYNDLDRGYSLKYRDLATGWGGSGRMWFLDLSAGPTFVSEWYDLPIQVLEEDQKVNQKTSSGGLWLTEFLGDYVTEFVYNFAAPNFVYDPPISGKYRIEVNILDDRNGKEREAVPIMGTINGSLIRQAIKSLVPYSEVEVNIRFRNTSDYPQLDSLMKTSSGLLDSWIHRYLFLSHMNISYIDATPIYDYFDNNLDRFVQNFTRGGNEYVIPVFAFALGDDTHFMFKYKWLIMKPDLETGAIWGVTFKNFTLVGLSQKDFLRGNDVEPRQQDKGFGFTESVIHEVGHAFGLMHPHEYGDLGDFVSSAMSYYAYEYNFSAFDRDALQRNHVDKLLMELNKKIIRIKGSSLEETETQDVLANFTNRMTDLLRTVDYEYSTMNYTGASGIALEADAYADEVLGKIHEGPVSIERLISQLKAKILETERLNATCTALKTDYDLLRESHAQMQSEFNDLQGRNTRLMEELAQARLQNYVFISIAVASLAMTIIVTRRSKTLR